MPATLKSVTSKVNTVAVEIDGDPKGITVNYTTRKLTPRVQAEIDRFFTEGKGDSVESVIEQFLVMAVSWDFVPDEGKPPIPLTKEALMDVPLEILGDVLGAITDDLSPKEATDDSSNTP